MLELNHKAWAEATRAYNKTAVGGPYSTLAAAIKAYKITEKTLEDPLVQSVMERMASRSEQGMKTYGVTMERPDVSTVEWLRHAQEEALDLAIYLERCIRDLSKD